MVMKIEELPENVLQPQMIQWQLCYDGGSQIINGFYMVTEVVITIIETTTTIGSSNTGDVQIT